MDSINLADLKQELDTLIDRLEAGDSIDITRDGQPFARITPTPPVAPAREPFDFARLKALTDSLPMQSQSSAELIREMRDSARY